MEKENKKSDAVTSDLLKKAMNGDVKSQIELFKDRKPKNW